MSEPVFWIVEGVIQQGALAALRSLIGEMVTITQANEPGTMAYEWFLDSGKQRCHIFERYRDSTAAMIHLRTFEEKFAKRLGLLVKIDRVVVYGNATEELIKALGDEGTVFLLPWAGFTR